MSQIFISYAREDSETAEDIDRTLRRRGFDVWLDKRELDPGVRWKSAIRRAIDTSDYFVAILSKNSIDKRGFVQKELRQALDILDEHPDDEIFLVPVRIDNCVPSYEGLREINWLDLFPDYRKGISRLLKFFTKKLPDVVTSVETLGIAGTWHDPADDDTCFFKQRGHIAVAFYDYDGRQDKVGTYIGRLKGRTLFYGWKWLQGKLEGYGEMLISDDEMSLSGRWWYGTDDSSIEHVGYQRMKEGPPVWLKEEDFGVYANLLNPYPPDTPEFFKFPIPGPRPTAYDRIFWERLSRHTATARLFSSPDHANQAWERLPSKHRYVCVQCHNEAMIEGWHSEPEARKEVDRSAPP